MAEPLNLHDHLLRLETPRLMLKPHTLANVEKMLAWTNDLEMAYLHDDDSDAFEPVSQREMSAHVHLISQPDPYSDAIHAAIHLKDGDALIGLLNVFSISPHHRRCKLGIVIGEQAMWGKGYAREALEAVIGYCFDTLNMNRLIAEIYAFNERSIKLFEALGFKREGLLRQSVWKNGKPIDDCVYALLREDWQAQSK